MTKQLETLVRHFQDSSRDAVGQAGQALAEHNWVSFQTVVDRVASLGVTASVSNLVNSSRDNFRALLDRIETEFDPRAIRLVFGGIVGGVGACALVEAAGLAAAVGVSIISIQVIALVLLVFGILTALPAIWSLALERIDEFELRLAAP